MRNWIELIKINVYHDFSIGLVQNSHIEIEHLINHCPSLRILGVQLVILAVLVHQVSCRHSRFVQNGLAIHQCWNTMLDVQLEVLLGLVFTLEEIAFDHVVFQTQTLGRHVDDAAGTRQIHSMNINRHFEEFLRVVIND